MSPNEKPKNLQKITSSQHHSLKLNELLSRRRHELKLSLDDIERSTHIRRKYLVLIEAGDYTNLPDDVYSRGYVKNYSEQLGFDTAQLLKIYSRERYDYDSSFGNLAKPQKKASLKPIVSQTYSITPRIILMVLTSIFVLAMVMYVGWQLSQISAPPAIHLANQDKTSTGLSFVIISGEVDSGADVFINDSPILSSPDGSFSDRVMLVNGSNQIKVTARNKFGKESSKTIIVEATIATAKDPALTTARTTPFSGVEVSLTAGPQAVFITIKADGKDVFKGTMLPGSKQLFQGKESIRISTSDAGSTSVVLTNAVVASVNIGFLGSEGEPKHDILFNKDTFVK